MIIRPAPPGILCLDTVTPCGDADIQAFWNAGFRAAFRYAQNVTAGEFALWLGRGFGFGLVGYSREPGWSPSAETGHEDAAAMLAAAKRLGIPAGLTLWNDFEGPAKGTAPEAAIAHVDAYAADIAAAQDIAGVYIGSGPILTGAEWYARPNVHRYAKAGSRQRDRFDAAVEPARGYCWTQGLPFNETVQGSRVVIDKGFLAQDYGGDSVTLVYAE